MLAMLALGFAALTQLALSSADRATRAELADALALVAPGDTRAVHATDGRLPLAFVPNAGQSDTRVRFQAQAGGVSFFFTRTELVLSFGRGRRGHALALRFLGADPRVEIRATRQGSGRVSYLLGADARKWRRGLPAYGELVYRDLWPGIDLAFGGVGGELKYEFRLAPGAQVEKIRLAYAGAERLSLTPGGGVGDLHAVGRAHGRSSA